MLFNSISFLIFFPVVTFLFFLPSSKKPAAAYQSRLFLLLAASIYFYAVFIPKFIIVLFFLIAVDYLAGLLIDKAQGTKRKTYLIISLIANIGTLAFFKYFDFFNENLAWLLNTLHFHYTPRALSLILPIGLSFHTFQSMSYTIEVYKGRQKPEKNLLVYSLYVLFYPQLVAGPIERPQNLLHQFYDLKDFDFDRCLEGLELMIWGLFKKIFVADRLAIFANEVFNSSGQNQTSKLSVILGVYFFSFQIYCDFSGYTDIARGAARVMGFHLIENFKNPYQARSISEFWQRWHISLSTWFRDYLYIPLGGSRVSFPRSLFNIMVVFLLSGLWHGANWTFIAWGALHGLYLITERLWGHVRGVFSYPEKLKPRRHFLREFAIFNLVSFAWIFFRAKSVLSAGMIISSIITQSLALKVFLHDLLFRESMMLHCCPVRFIG